MGRKTTSIEPKNGMMAEKRWYLPRFCGSKGKTFEPKARILVPTRLFFVPDGRFSVSIQVILDETTFRRQS